MHDGRVRLGVVGCGGFGLFALQQFTQVPGVTLAGMAGTHRPAALAAAARFGVENVGDAADPAGGVPEDWLFLALAHAKLGDAAEAKKWLAKAAAAPGGKGDAWARAEWDLFRREAEAAVRP